MKNGLIIFAFIPVLFFASFSLAQYQGLGQQSVSEETIKKYAPPALEKELSRSIQNKLDIRAPSLGILHPNKKSLFFNWKVSGSQQVWRIDGPKSFPVQLTAGEDPTYVVGLSPDGKWLVISRDFGGEENPGLYLMNTIGGPLIKIQHKEKVQTNFEFISTDSKYLYYRSNELENTSYAIYRYDLETKNTEVVFSQKGIWSVVDYKDDGRLLLSLAVTNLASEVYEWNPATKELKPILGRGEKEEYDVNFAAKENEYLVSTPKFGEYRRLYLYTGKDFKPISADIKFDVSSYSIDKQRKNIYYTINEGGYTKLKWIDAKTFKENKLPDFKNVDHVYVGSVSRDGKDIILGVENAQAPRTSYVFNIASKKLTQWVVPSAPEADLATFVPAKLEYYDSRDAVKIPMFVRRPLACNDIKSNCPVVVHFHGGPEAQTEAGFSVFAQLFVDAGFIFVEPNVRGSDGYGKSWINSDNGALRLNVITDIEDASIFIRKNWGNGSNPLKIGIMGWSYGGYSTLYAMTKFAGAYDAGVALVGMSNLETFLLNTAPYRRALRIPEYGDPVKDKEALKRLSAFTYLDQIKSPLMIVQGVNDPRVPVGEALQIQSVLEKKKIPSKLILFADEGHGTQKRSNNVLELGHTILFFKQNLK